MKRLDRRLALWLLLLALAQLADVVSTAIDLGHGTVEGNQVAASLLQTGGLGLLMLLKLALVAALGLAALLARRWHQARPGPMGILSQRLIWRGTQVSAVFIFLVAAHNVYLLATITLGLA